VLPQCVARAITRSRREFLSRDRHRSPAASEVVGDSARDDEPRSSPAAAGQHRGSLVHARGDVRLVHRGLRHGRPERAKTLPEELPQEVK